MDTLLSGCYQQCCAIQTTCMPNLSPISSAEFSKIDVLITELILNEMQNPIDLSEINIVGVNWSIILVFKLR